MYGPPLLRRSSKKRARSPDLGNQRTGNIQFNRRLWRWLHLSRKCHAKGGKRRQKCGKRQQRKEKAGCGNLPQLAEFVRLAELSQLGTSDPVKCFGIRRGC